MNVAQLTTAIQATINDGGFFGKNEAVGGRVENGMVTGSTIITYLNSQ
jgi:hypothetical protein